MKKCIIEVETIEDRDELLRAIKLLEKYPIPFTADITYIKEQLESF